MQIPPALEPIKTRLDRVMQNGVTLHYGDKTYQVTGQRLANIIYLTPGGDALPVRNSRQPRPVEYPRRKKL